MQRYFGITSAKPKDRLAHLRNTKQCAKGSTAAEHTWTFDLAYDQAAGERHAPISWIGLI